MDTKRVSVSVYNAHVQVIGILWTSNCSIVSTPYITSLGVRLFYVQFAINNAHS